MPRKAKIPCNHKGCPVLIESGTGNYCAEHRSLKHSNYNRTREDKETIKMYSTARWKRVRRLALVRDGSLCQMCLAKTADLVDHITEIKDGGDPYDLSNLQSLCNRCHSIKTKDEASNRK